MRKIVVLLIILTMLSTMAFAATRIELYIDYEIATVDGKYIAIDEENPNVTPIIRNNRTLLPVRFIAENLGMTVTWEESTKTVTLTGDKTITLVIDSTTAYINGTPQALDSAPIIHENRTYLPIRFISEALDKQVDWDEFNERVTIRPIPPVYDAIEVFNGLTFEPVFPAGLSNTWFSEMDYIDGYMYGDCGVNFGPVNDPEALILDKPMADFFANLSEDTFPVMFNGAVVKTFKIIGAERFAIVNATVTGFETDSPTDNIMYLVYDKDTGLFVFAAVIGTDQAAMDKLNEIIAEFK